MEPLIGEIRLVGFTYAPIGWLDCDGSVIPISQYETLFTLIGTTYGGDGQETFALPDLRSRVPVGTGTGPGLSGITQGEVFGVEQVTLTTPQLPAHSHPFLCSGALGTSADPNGLTFAHVTNGARGDNHYGTTADGLANSGTISSFGGNQPHNNLQPFTVLRYIIATEGVFPQQN